MLKKFALILTILSMPLTVHSYQECIITNNGKLTDINIEDNTLIDVYPLVTVMNEKNTLVVHPLKSGKTRFCVLKNNKNLELFEVSVTDFETRINAPDGFEVLSGHGCFPQANGRREGWRCLRMRGLLFCLLSDLGFQL